MKNANMLQWLFIIALYKLIGFNLKEYKCVVILSKAVRCLWPC